MVLTIDAGNTSCKLIVFNDTTPVFRMTVVSPRYSDLLSLEKKFPIDHVILSSVVNIPKSFLSRAAKKFHLTVLGPDTPIPIKNKYGTPKTLGTDRLASAIAADFLFPGKNVLVIDVGTCIKYDFVSAKGAYLGGSISPGLMMRFRAMHEFTGRLPLIQPANVKALEGKTTGTSMQTGVIIGMTEEINGFISRYRRKYKSLKVILTGGDALRFAGKLKIPIFAAADLVNIGLNETVRYNVAR